MISTIFGQKLLNQPLEKNPDPFHRRSLEIPVGRGFQKPKVPLKKTIKLIQTEISRGFRGEGFQD